jgi:hypothetical protein
VLYSKQDCYKGGDNDDTEVVHLCDHFDFVTGGPAPLKNSGAEENNPAKAIANKTQDTKSTTITTTKSRVGSE